MKKKAWEYYEMAADAGSIYAKIKVGKKILAEEKTSTKIDQAVQYLRSAGALTLIPQEESKEVKDWSKEDVQNWLRRRHIFINEAFIADQIDGRKFLTLKQNDLESYGIKDFQRDVMSKIQSQSLEGYSSVCSSKTNSSPKSTWDLSPSTPDADLKYDDEGLDIGLSAWICQACTYPNTWLAVRCSMCTGARGPSSASSSPISIHPKNTKNEGKCISDQNSFFLSNSPPDQSSDWPYYPLDPIFLSHSSLLSLPSNITSEHNPKFGGLDWPHDWRFISLLQNLSFQFTESVGKKNLKKRKVFG